jgi:hypothetical protein
MNEIFSSEKLPESYVAEFFPKQRYRKEKAFEL